MAAIIQRQPFAFLGRLLDLIENMKVLHSVLNLPRAMSACFQFFVPFVSLCSPIAHQTGPQRPLDKRLY
jgi:hypothetical protein